MNVRLQTLKSDIQIEVQNLYRYDLRPEGVQKALLKAQELETIYQADIETFLGFIDNV